MPGPSHLELLAIEVEDSLDPRGRIAGYDGVTILCSADGQALWIGAEVPDATAAELTAAFEHAPRPARPSDPPPALDLCQPILAPGGPLQRYAGPSYLMPHDTRFASDAVIVHSGQPGHSGHSGDREFESLRGANPGNWEPVEWDELLDGQLGPWAIIAHDGQAASICHTPRRIAGRAVECGTWTAPAFRGRGYAAATAAAWVALVRSPDRILFYSTSADNRSSQSVARRLQLPEIGWTWRLHHPRARQEPDFHPLSSLVRSVDHATRHATRS